MVTQFVICITRNWNALVVDLIPFASFDSVRVQHVYPILSRTHIPFRCTCASTVGERGAHTIEHRGTWTILWWLVVQEVRDHKCLVGTIGPRPMNSYKMPARESDPTSLNLYTKILFFFSLLFRSRGTLGLLSSSSLSLFFLFLSRVIFKIMKFAPILLFVIAIVFAAEEKKEEERPKTFRRLIPADVLRGKFPFFFCFLLFLKFEKFKFNCLI